MKKVYVEGLVTGSDFDEFFLLKSATVRVGSNQKNYIDMILGDKTGDVSAKKWDASDAEIDLVNSYDENIIVKVRASVSEWQGKKQLKITKFREALPDDDFDVDSELLYLTLILPPISYLYESLVISGPTLRAKFIPPL